jgi:hypothetical protein
MSQIVGLAFFGKFALVGFARPASERPSRFGGLSQLIKMTKLAMMNGTNA